MHAASELVFSGWLYLDISIFEASAGSRAIVTGPLAIQKALVHFIVINNYDSRTNVLEKTN